MDIYIYIFVIDSLSELPLNNFGKFKITYLSSYILLKIAFLINFDWLEYLEKNYV